MNNKDLSGKQEQNWCSRTTRFIQARASGTNTRFIQLFLPQKSLVGFTRSAVGAQSSRFALVAVITPPRAIVNAVVSAEVDEPDDALWSPFAVEETVVDVDIIARLTSSGQGLGNLTTIVAYCY